jgi:hypothetical protein
VGQWRSPPFNGKPLVPKSLVAIGGYHCLLPPFAFNALNFPNPYFTNHGTAIQKPTPSTSFSGSEDWGSPSNLKMMSISELFFELRDTFMRSDFDLVEKTLIAREEILKEEIEKMKRE